jgi:polyisoprenoid-binding protein YceI
MSNYASTWQIDSERSLVEFSVPYLTFKRVRGRFKRFSGSIHVDPEDLSAGWAEVTLDPASIDTGLPARDESLRTKGFLEVARFPSCSFRARRIEGSAEGRQRLFGDLLLHGRKGELELELVASPPRRDARGRRMRFLATGAFDRKHFGVDWPTVFDISPLLIGHRVELTLVVEGVEGPA